MEFIVLLQCLILISHLNADYFCPKRSDLKFNKIVFDCFVFYPLSYNIQQLSVKVNEAHFLSVAFSIRGGNIRKENYVNLSSFGNPPSLDMIHIQTLYYFFQQSFGSLFYLYLFHLFSLIFCCFIVILLYLSFETIPFHPWWRPRTAIITQILYISKYCFTLSSFLQEIITTILN